MDLGTGILVAGLIFIAVDNIAKHRLPGPKPGETVYHEGLRMLLKANGVEFEVT
jgi:hypothetical protein